MFSMNIIIIGAGRIGAYLALLLSQEKHSITLVDKDPEALEKVSRSADIATRLGEGTDPGLLEELLESNPAIFLALTDRDETNLVACSLAKHLGIPKTVARIKKNCFLRQNLLNLKKIFNVDYLMGTELIVAQGIFKAIMNSGNLALENFAHGHVQMRTVLVPRSFKGVGQTLSNLQLNDKLLVGLIRRKIEGKKETIIFPQGQDQLLEGDEATLIGETSVMQGVTDLFDLKKKELSSAVIIGASGVVINLCRLLEAQNIQVKIIEPDEEKCKLLASLFPAAVILNHEGTDLSFLQEERIYASDVFIAATPSHEKNILAAALAKQVGCKEVVALISDDSCLPLLRRLEIHHILSERESIAAQIQALLYDESVISIASLHENQAKILEVKISKNSGLAGAPLSALKASFPPNFLIAMIETAAGVTIPKGGNVLHPGDRAILICSPGVVQDVEKIL